MCWGLGRGCGRGRRVVSRGRVPRTLSDILLPYIKHPFIFVRKLTIFRLRIGHYKIKWLTKSPKSGPNGGAEGGHRKMAWRKFSTSFLSIR
jgi:hypothetical protein